MFESEFQIGNSGSNGEALVHGYWPLVRNAG